MSELDNSNPILNRPKLSIPHKPSYPEENVVWQVATREAAT